MKCLKMKVGLIAFLFLVDESLRIASNFHLLVARGQHADVGYVGCP
jgi:hypothetical protein